MPSATSSTQAQAITSPRRGISSGSYTWGGRSLVTAKLYHPVIFLLEVKAPKACYNFRSLG